MAPSRKPRGTTAENRRQRVARLATTFADRRHTTRFIMLLVVSGAAVAGFLSSVILLWMGLRYMPVRYALAGVAGYSVFLALMNLWLGRHSHSALLDRAGDIGGSFDLPGGLFRGGSNLAKR